MKLLSEQEALQIVLSSAQKLAIEIIPTTAALGRITRQEVISDVNMPPFNKSAMDGYACKREDLGEWLTVTETIAAGKAPQYPLQSHQCAKIMTGAALPEGADLVFMKEVAEIYSDGRVRCVGDSKNNICYTAEDICESDKVMDAYTCLQAKHMPILASVGCTQIEVSTLPKVSILTTGTELVEPDTLPPAFKIRNSNASQVLAQLQALNISGHYEGIVSDESDQLLKTLQQLIQKSDVILLTGGVSVGDFDLVPGILAQLGFEIKIDGTAIQPGKPMVFAQQGEKYVFGLSGNPVSSFIQFELYVKPFLFALQGHRFNPIKFQMNLANDYARKKDHRLQLVPAKINDKYQVEPITFHGSAHIHALTHADCLIEVPIGIKDLDTNKLVTIRLL